VSIAPKDPDGRVIVLKPPKKTKKKRCVPVYDESLMELDEDGNPSQSETNDRWPASMGANPCCPGTTNPWPEGTEESERWFDFRDQYCPVYVEQPPKPEPPEPPPRPPWFPPRPKPVIEIAMSDLEVRLGSLG